MGFRLRLRRFIGLLPAVRALKRKAASRLRDPERVLQKTALRWYYKRSKRIFGLDSSKRFGAQGVRMHKSNH